MLRFRLPDFPALHDIPNLIPHQLGHRVAVWTGMEHAYAFFCHHCPEPDLWAAVVSALTGDTPGASTTETDLGGTLSP